MFSERIKINDYSFNGLRLHFNDVDLMFLINYSIKYKLAWMIGVIFQMDDVIVCEEVINEFWLLLYDTEIKPLEFGQLTDLENRNIFDHYTVFVAELKNNEKFI